jgi:cytoskeletal protein RodZ
MEQQERRAALSAFFWTITVMAIAGGILFWQADAIPQVPIAQANDGAVSQYTAAIISLEQQLAQPVVVPQEQIADVPAAPTITSATALTAARSIAGALEPLTPPELVDLDGQTVWAIAYEPGTIYVSATVGSVVSAERNQPDQRDRAHDDDHDDEDNDD